MKALPLLVIGLQASLLGGCADYLDRRETVFFGAGNAVQTNAAAHVIDPWPPHAQRTRIEHDGDRLQRAIERYRINPPPKSDSAESASSATGAS